MPRTLENPTVQINNITIPVKPNSLSYKTGRGDRNIRVQSAGGDSIETVMTEDAETKKSMIKATFLMTKDIDASVIDWMDKRDENSIRLSEGDFTKSFRKMAVVSEPELNTGADGEVEVEFEGPPVL